MINSENSDLTAALEVRAQKVERFFNQHFSSHKATENLSADREVAMVSTGFTQLIEAVRYSSLQNGKRFRPTLAMLTAEALGYSAERVIPYAVAVECIHTYSLIHDDLPCMDNDDFRRGKPSNHKVFGEATALLAGDALLTEAFDIIATHYDQEPVVALRAVRELARASGMWGMVGGQAMDLAAKESELTRPTVELTHKLKTGALIKAATLGAAHLCFANDQQIKELTLYSENLGLAFQVADDLLDHQPDKVEAGSYPALVGVDGTRSFLNQLTEDCLARLESWGSKAEPLRELARFNRTRVI